MAFFGSQLADKIPTLGQDIEAPLTEAFGAVYDVAEMENPMAIINRMAEHRSEDFNPISTEDYRTRYREGDTSVSYREGMGFVERKETISFEQAQEMAVQRGIDPARLPKDTTLGKGRKTRRGIKDREQVEQFHSKDYWNSILDVLEDKTERENIIQRADKGPGFYAGSLTVGIAAFAQDPLNIATFAFPALGAASRVAAVSKISSLTGRVSARAGIGFAEGTVGAAAFEPMYYGLIRQEDLDYDMTDSLVNITVGGAFGAVANVAISPAIERGFIAGEVDKILDSVAQTAEEVKLKAQAKQDLFFRRYDAPELKTTVANAVVQADRQTLEVVMRAAVNQLMDGKPLDVMNILVSDLRVSQSMDRIRGTSNEQMLRNVIDDAMQVDVSARLSKGKRTEIATEIERIRDQMEQIAKSREDIKQRTQGLPSDEALKLIKEDVRIKGMQEQLQRRMSSLKNKLGKSRDAKAAQAKINSLQEQVDSGDFFENAMMLTQDSMRRLNQIAPDRSDFTVTRSTDKVMKSVDSMQEKVAVKSSTDEKVVDAEAEELQKILDGEVNESDMNAMKEVMSKHDEEAKVLADAIEEFKACRVS